MLSDGPQIHAGRRGRVNRGVVSMTAMTMPARAVTQAPLSYRKSVDRLRDPQLEALRQAYSMSMALSDERGFEFWAGLHGLPLPMY